MQEYIEYHDEDKPKHEEVKNEGNYAEPIESESEVETLNTKEQETESSFTRNQDKFKRPTTIVLVVAIGGLMAMFVLSKVWMSNSELLRIIVQGNRITKTEEIERAVSRFVGKKMNDVSLSDIIDTLQALPYIRKVVATKELPDAVRLRVQERQPIAMVVLKGELKLIDEDGCVMNRNETVFKARRLPFLTGFTRVVKDSSSTRMKLDSTEAAGAIAFCKALCETRYAKLLVSQVHIAGENRLEVFTAEGDARFIFGRGDYEQRLNNFEIFWQQVVVKKGLKPFEYIDVRFEGKIFAKEQENNHSKQKFQN